MATSKNIKATATYEKDTAKGKRRYDVSDGKKVTGTIYIDDKSAPDEFEVVLTPAES